MSIGRITMMEFTSEEAVDDAEILYEKIRAEAFPTLELVNHIKLLNTPVICFPRGIKNYNEFVSTIKPDVINIDYDIDPKKISKEIDITIQGGLDPKILLTDKENLKKKHTII